jgi:ubiquitin-protein ligase
MLTSDIYSFNWKPFILDNVEDKKFTLRKDLNQINFSLIGDNIIVNNDILDNEEINLKLSLYQKLSFDRIKHILMEYFKESKNEILNPPKLFLDNQKIYYKFPLDQSFLFQNSEKISTKVISNVFKNNLSSEQIKEIIFKEIKNFNTNQSHPHFIEPKSLFDFKVHLINDKKEIIFNVILNSQHYPYAPPQISWISPKVSLDKLADLYDCEIFTKKWNPTISLEWLFLQLNQVFIQKEYYSEDNQSFDILENNLIDLIKLHNLIVSSSPIKIEYSLIDFSSTNKKDYWKSGTGYGHSNSTKWSIEEYLMENNLITDSMIKVMETIKNNYTIEEFNKISIDIQNKFYQILNIEIKELNLLELEKKNQYYFELFSLILLVDKSKINTSSIYDLIESISNLPVVPEKLISVNTILQQIKPQKEIIEDLENSSYEDKMKSLLFDYIDISKETKYKYHDKSGKPSSSKQMIRLVQDISAIKKSLPCNKESTVWVRWDKNNMTKMQFIISGPKDTPYQDALFLFDTYFPPEYPSNPPIITLQTTGNGTVRFNPNLYDNGKVCLSLLGTWSGEGGEKWNEKSSTLLQILVSIQSLILIEEPYFNEPGYERNINTLQGKENSFAYNDERRWQSIKWGVIDMIKNPPKGFEEIVKIHFQEKLKDIKETTEKWKKETKKYQKEYENLLEVLSQIDI